MSTTKQSEPEWPAYNIEAIEARAIEILIMEEQDINALSIYKMAARARKQQLEEYRDELTAARHTGSSK